MGMTVWCGETNNSDGPWSITEETPVADVLSRVCFIIAGVLGEMLYARDAFRSGSSLDETVMAQMVIGGLSSTARTSSPASRIPGRSGKRSGRKRR